MTPDPATVCRRLIPAQYWRETLIAIVRSVEVAHQEGPDRWGLRLDDDSLMLKVGPHEVLQLGAWNAPFHLIVDRELVPTYLRSRADLVFSEDRDCYGKPGASGYYASDPGTEACDFGFPALKEVYQALSDAHIAVVRRASRMRRHPSTRPTHSSALVSFLASETDHRLAQPAYLDDESGTTQLIPEEVTEDERYVEGAVRQVVVNAYERDRGARARCLAHYGPVCAACGMSFERWYGPDAAGIIHVHHVVPLHEIGEAYQVDPIRDLRPICPNCHAVIHARKPARSIDEVARMVRRGQGQP